ncbi:MAG: mannosyltransferase family protein [Candidatus Bathyarchaeota archaeon]|nr:mannosyltransferase family protein [Candidatus Bathyarchaeota archaeon]
MGLAGKLENVYSSELGKVLLIGLSSRLLIFVSAAAGYSLFGPGMANPNSTSPFINLFSQWDAAWYNTIAVNWYPTGADPLSGNWAFFPLYPALMRIFGTPLTPFMLPEQAYYLSGFLINNLLFFACLILFYKVTQTIFNNQKYSLISTVFFAFWPGALFYSVVYSESLFMIFALGAFYFLERGSVGKSTVLAVLAAATRSNGFMILIPFVYAGLQKRKIKTTVVQSVCIFLPYLLFTVYGYALTGLFPIREIVYSQIWGAYAAQPIAFSLENVGYALLYIAEGVLIALPFIWFARNDKVPIKEFMLGLNHRKDLKYWVLAAVIVIMLLFYADPKNLHRYALPMLPLYWGFAWAWCKNEKWGKLLLAIFIAIMILGTTLFALGGYYI